MSEVETKTVVTIQLSNCIDCTHHKVMRDPDPSDWFCDDDVKVVCSKANRNITVSCRPYNTQKESAIPDWCPLIV